MEDAAMWLVTLATATAGEIPRKIRSGVMREPPPTPVIPTRAPTQKPERM
jgi:hypothetical protein